MLHGARAGNQAAAASDLCYRDGVFKILDRVLEAKGAGWSVLRFALIVAPAVIALVVLNMFFRLD